MANEYLIPLGADLGPLLKDISTLKTDLVGLQKSVKDYGDASKKAFTEANGAQTALLQTTVASNKEAKQQAAEVKQLESMFESYGSSVDEAAISQAQLNKALSSGIDAANKQLSGLKEGSKEYNKLAKEIKAAEVGLQSLNKGTGDSEKKFEKMKKTLADNKSVLQQLAAQGLQNTKIFKDLEKQTGELDDTIRDVNEAIRLAGSDTKSLDNLIGSATAVTGAFSIAQGAVALFGKENENIEKALLKVNAAMSILNGLQAIQAELKRKDSLVSRAAAAAQAGYATVVGTSTGALKLFRVALASTGIGLLVIALGTLVANFDKVKAKVLEMFPGLETLGRIVGGVVEKFTDWIGITSEAERELSKTSKATGEYNQRLERTIQILEAQGGKEREIYELRRIQISKQLEDLKKKQDTIGKLSEEEIADQLDLTTQRQVLDAAERKRQADEAKKSAEERERERKDREQKNKEAAEKRIEIEKEQQEKLIALDKQFRDLKIAAIDDETARALAANDAQFEDLKGQAQAQVDQFKGSEEQRKSIQEAANLVIEQLQRNHYAATLKIAKDGYDARQALLKEAAAAEEQIILDATEAEAEAINKKGLKINAGVADFSKKQLDIFAALNKEVSDSLVNAGFSEEQAQQIISTAKDVFNGIVDAYAESIDRQIEAKQRQVEALTTQIDEVEDELRREEELQKSGYANNVKAKQEEIAKLKAEREKQLEQERRLQKERAKIASLEIAISTVQQTAILAQTAAELFKNAAKSSFNPIAGVILGIAAAASMFSGFLAIKNRIKSSQDQVPKFRRGDVFDILKGKASHESGGVSLVDNNGDRLAEFEGNEKLFVINRAASANHEDLLRAINKDDFSDFRASSASFQKMMRQMKGVGIVERAPHRLIHSQRRLAQIQSAQKEDTTQQDILAEVRAFKKQAHERPLVIDEGDIVEVREGNYKKRIRKKK